MTTVFGHSVRWDLLFLCLVEAVIWFCAFALLLAWGTSADPQTVITFAAALALGCALISGATGLYQPDVLARMRRLMLRTAVAGALLLIIWPVLRAVGPAYMELYRFEVLLGFATTVFATRLAIGAATRHGLLRHRIVTLAAEAPSKIALTSRVPASLGEAARPADIAVEVVASFESPAALAAAMRPEELRRRGVRCVVAADPAGVPCGFRAECEQRGIRVLSAAAFREERLLRVDVDDLPQDWLAGSRAAREGRIGAALHRLLDLMAGVILLGITLPLLILTALAIKLDSPGPIFYRQERIGRNGLRFMLVKFRSMRVDAEAAGRPMWASRHDPRVTRVGRIIRRTRIDEIPQVFNVLRGEMAFVGPRPERPGFVEQLRNQIPHYDDRAAVKPGITGWAQVNYPYGASVEDARMKLAYDLYYVRRRSLFLDLIILLATIRVVLFQEGSR